MAVIKLLYDLTDKQFSVGNVEVGTVYNETGDVNYDDLYVVFGFTDKDKMPINFNNLKFGLSLYKNDTLIYSHSFPADGIEYMRTSSPYIEHCKTVVEPGSLYKLSAYVNENYVEKTIDIDVEIPNYSNYELEYSESHPEQPDYELFIREHTSCFSS